MEKIKFEIPNLVSARVTIYDILGREVATLMDKKLTPGHHEINVKESGLPGGIYFCKIVTDGFSETRKIEILK